MKLQRGIRARLGGALLAGIAALAILALPGLATGHKGGNHKPAAGVIESFDADTGVLTVDLRAGRTISALVIDRTRIRCGKPHRRPHRGRRHARAAKREQRGRDGSAVNDDVRGPRDQGEDRGPRGQGEDVRGEDGPPLGTSDDPVRGHKRPDRCNTDDLVPGAIVQRADIVLTHGNAFYRLVGLHGAVKSPAPEEPGSDEPGSDEPGPEEPEG